MQGFADLKLGVVSECLYPRLYEGHAHCGPNAGSIPNVSNLVQRAKEVGVSVLGLANYWPSPEQTEQFVGECFRERIAPLLGMEVVAFDHELADQGVLVNDTANPGQIYVVGGAMSGLLCPSNSRWPLVHEIARADRWRIKEMIRLANSHCKKLGIGVEIDYDELREQLAREANVPVDAVVGQERQLANALIHCVFQLANPEDAFKALAVDLPVEDPQGAVRSAMFKTGRPAFVPLSTVPLDEARDIIEGLGGTVIYPLLLDGVGDGKPFNRFEASPEALAERLRDLGIGAVQFIPHRNDPEVLALYARHLRSEGFLGTVGGEHNTPAPRDFRPTCKHGHPIPADLVEWFWEGVCYLFALQTLDILQPGGHVVNYGWRGMIKLGDALIRQINAG